MTKLVVILGPTASGKTDLALRLARKLGGEIVNADSRQVYDELFIGTATPLSKGGSTLVEGVPHHLFGIVPPDHHFTVAEYKKRALAAIDDIAGRGALPFLVGGTGLYLWTVIDNLLIPEIPANDELRAALESKETQALFEALNKKDPDAARVTGFNKRRIIRALEVVEATGRKFSDLRKAGAPLFDVLQIGLSIPFDGLDKRIELRAREMLDAGLVDEVSALRAKYPAHLPTFDSPGYRQFIDYLQGRLTFSEAVERFIRSHKRLARKQMTWFKRDKRINWFAHEAARQIRERVATFVN